MSSHREAPSISKDPVADNTDTYAFVDPNDPTMVTILANFIPLEGPDAGPNFFEFGDDVLYSINIDNVGDGLAHISYQFRFTTTIRNTNTFLYNTGPINNITDTTWNRPQSYSMSRIDASGGHVLATGLMSPPCNIGIRSTPNYATLADQAVHTLGSGETVYCGQRREGFYLDLGSIFDLLALRPFQNLHRFATPAQDGVDSTKFVNVHTIALKVPINKLTKNGSRPTNTLDPNATIGVWAAASRQKVTIHDLATPPNGTFTNVGPFVQVSRLGSPLVNEVLIPMAQKDLWNANTPEKESRFLSRYLYPEVQALLVYLYPTAFPNLATITGPTAGSPAGGFQPRNDLKAIFLTGIPAGIISPTFQNVIGGNAANVTLADMLRLNVAVPPKPVGTENAYGVLGGDLAGFPNGRRVYDDVVTIELRALAGATYPLVQPSYTPDGAAGLIYDVNPPTYSDRFHATFPYLGLPHDGYEVPTATQQMEIAPTPA